MAPDRWRNAPEILALGPDEVHVWRVTVPPQLPAVDPEALHLSAAERARAGRFHFEADRDRFILGHGALRWILSRYLGLGPGAIVFDQGPQGKPHLKSVPDRDGLTFNLSHSGSLVLVAVGRGREIGVDVEKIRPEIDLEGIAGRFFSEAEQKALLALAPPQRPAAFFRCWTRKEAYIKARGGGLSIPLRQFDVTLDPDAEAALLATRDESQEAGCWSLYNLDVGDEGYLAALAVEGGEVKVKLWDWAWGKGHGEGL